MSHSIFLSTLGLFYPIFLPMHRTEGIILNTLNFKDYDQIVTVFSKDEGLIKLIFKGANSRRRGKGALTNPFTRAEFIYAKGKGELYQCKEVSLLNQHLRLRESLSKLETACDLVQALAASQLPHKASSALYALFAGYLERIAFTEHPEAYAASFRLKILRHDGLYGIGPECSVCRAALQTLYVDRGESYCGGHAPKYALQFTLDESELLSELAFSRSYSRLSELRVTGSFAAKVRQLFAEQMER